jgi:hypothetical protein
MLLTLGIFQMPLDISRIEFMKEVFSAALLRRAQWQSPNNMKEKSSSKLEG